MNRDHALYLVAGLLGGFVLGYLAHEAMASRQPPRFGVPVAPATAPGTASPAAGGAMPPVERLRQAVEANPDDADAVLALANANFDIQNWGRAIELYQRYDQLRPGDANALTDLGVSLRETGRIDEAIALFRRASELAPDHWQSRFNEAIVLAFDRRDFAAADRAVAELRRLQPANPDLDRLAREIDRLRGGG
ncbi:MAG TPA: tetratricopeptide repeat protein [Thermoanaerobaculia bacterium]|nr:tetratricopeptide repeat protein [Thermoanaerobaculia bacterium]